MNRLLTVQDYPPQEPVPPKGQAYREEAARRAVGVEGFAAAYGDDIYQRIALFKPKQPNGTLLAYMHGGGWTSGYKEMMTFLAPGFTDAGITFASIGYRLAPEHIFPAGRDDAADGMRWLYEHADELGVSRRRIFIGGHSAGGHYAALLALARAWRDQRMLPADVVRGCVSVSGVFDLTSTGGLSMRPRFLGPADSGLEQAASPIHNIEMQPPPFLIAYGDQDFPNLRIQAQVMERTLREAGGDVESVELAGCDHFGASLAAGTPAQLQSRIIDWLSSH